MNDSQILSTFQDSTVRLPPAPAREVLVFDTCRAGVVLRAVLFVEVAVAVVALFDAEGAAAWVGRLALGTAGALPAVLLWLMARGPGRVSIDHLLSRRSTPARVG